MLHADRKTDGARRRAIEDEKKKSRPTTGPIFIPEIDDHDDDDIEEVASSS